MSLTFKNFAIPGLQEDYRIGAWDEQRELFSVFGLSGAVDLPGGLTTRLITVPMWVYGGFNSASLLLTFLDNLERYVGGVGPLVETTGPLLRTIKNCRMEPTVRQSEPIPPNPHIGWSILLELNFRQLAG